MSGMYHVWAVSCLGGMYGRYVGDVPCLGGTMSGRYHVWEVPCLGGMSGRYVLE